MKKAFLPLLSLLSIVALANNEVNNTTNGKGNGPLPNANKFRMIKVEQAAFKSVGHYLEYKKKLVFEGKAATEAYVRAEQQLAVDDYLLLSGGTMTGSLTTPSLFATDNIGIGTTTPAYSLEVKKMGLPLIASTDVQYGNGAYTSAFTSSGGNVNGFVGFRAEMSNGTSAKFYSGVHSPYGVRGAFAGTPDAIPFSLFTNATERLTILSNGNVGIGTTAPSEALSVVGAGLFGSGGYGLLRIGRDDGTNLNIENTSSDRGISLNAAHVVTGYNTDFVFGNNTGLLKANGSVGIGTSTPISKLEISETGTGTIVWPLTVTNPDNNNANNPSGTGSGIKFKMSVNSEPSKWAGIAGISESEWSNVIGLAFYTGTSGQQERVRISNGGNVGIGTTNPLAKLHVAGLGYFADGNTSGTSQNTFSLGNMTDGVTPQYQVYTNDNADQLLEFRSLRWKGGHTFTRNSPSGVKPLSKLTGYESSGAVYYLYNDASTAQVQLATDGVSYFNGGNLLIGKTSQTNAAYKLDVAGSVRANKVVVNTTGADFVFDSSYQLLPLDKVESFIKANKHLPEIAPASDMQQNGLDVGGNQTKLLQKVEELTLYMIETNKKLAEQQKKIDNLTAELEKSRKKKNR